MYLCFLIKVRGEHLSITVLLVKKHLKLKSFFLLATVL